MKKGLSAGRVQSVAVKLIIDREKEIRNFQPEEYWTVTAVLDAEGETFEAKFHGYGKKKKELKNEAEVKELLEAIKGKRFVVDEVNRSERRRNPAPPSSPAPSSRKRPASSISVRRKRWLSPSNSMKE